MRLDTEKGQQVVFVGRGGYDNQFPKALNALEIGSIYTVKSIRVGNWESSVFFNEVDGGFNSVMFENYPKEG